MPLVLFQAACWARCGRRQARLTAPPGKRPCYLFGAQQSSTVGAPWAGDVHLLGPPLHVRHVLSRPHSVVAKCHCRPAAEQGPRAQEAGS